ncbi:MAG: hypothetical protein ACW98G_17045 [Candidatus Hodarchaeales archaeon]
MKSASNFSIFTDGAARGNPGPAAAAFLFVKNDRIVHQQNSSRVPSNNKSFRNCERIHK